MQMLSVVQLKEGFEFILAPLHSDELRDINFLRNSEFDESSENNFDAILAKMEKEMSMAGLMKELGYGCKVNVSQCKEMLSLFLPPTEINVARILGTVVRTNDGLEDSQNIYSTFCSALGGNSLSHLPVFDSWNIDILFDSIKQLDPFPLCAVCGSVWKNAERQLSFLKYTVSVLPEVFSFAHSGRRLAYDDVVNVHKFQPGHTNHVWLCLNLLEVLCQLAERGHASSVRPILDYPLKHCPEVLLLGMANISGKKPKGVD